MKTQFKYCLSILLCSTLISSFSIANSKTKVHTSLYDFSTITISEESDPKINAQVKLMAQNLSDPMIVKENAHAILAQLHQGSKVDNYNFLWIPYALLKVV